jgi:hypothetical protein
VRTVLNELKETQEEGGFSASKFDIPVFFFSFLFFSLLSLTLPTSSAPLFLTPPSILFPSFLQFIEREKEKKKKEKKRKEKKEKLTCCVRHRRIPTPSSKPHSQQHARKQPRITPHRKIPSRTNGIDSIVSLKKIFFVSEIIPLSRHTAPA